jgi:iron only hydrogenase large subunit-like protein
MSAILSADDLNDFISPGVACIKPIETLPLQKTDEQINPYEVTTEDKILAENPPRPAQISLTDCLACSGCVTSAEAILVSLQSHAEVLSTLDSTPALDVARVLGRGMRNGGREEGEEQGTIFVASVSPQVRASLAATYGVSEREAGWMIDQLLAGQQGLASGGKYGNGFTWVVDTNAMREASLVLGADELRESLRTTGKTSHIHDGDGSANVQPQKPILSSACPGWICYAEKTHPHVLPHLSRLKSPQALTGTLLKTVLHTRLGIPPDRVWHVAVMPCFDKKLEASRPELTDISWRAPSSVADPIAPVRDVDCVITAREILMLADTRGISFPALPRRPLPLSTRVPFPDPILSSFLFPHDSHQRKSRTQPPAAGTSGGYLHHILATEQARHPGSKLTTTRGRNADVLEYAITPAGDSTPVFEAARYYGFRNIQNLVRKLKPARRSRFPASAGRRAKVDFGGSGPAGTGLQYAYIEVMACPGGCTNGGGQIKAEDIAAGTGLTPKEWIQKVDEAYFSMEEDEIENDDEDDDIYNTETAQHYTTNNENTTIPNTTNRSSALQTAPNHQSHDNRPSTGPGEKERNENEERDEIETDTINGIRPAHIHAILNHWAHITGVDLNRLVRTGYRGVESDVGKKGGAGGNADVDMARVVELAGKVGGGW